MGKEAQLLLYLLNLIDEGYTCESLLWQVRHINFLVGVSDRANTIRQGELLLGLPYDVIVAAVRGMAMTHNCAKTVWADDAHCHAWVLNRLNIIMVTLLSLPTENLPNLNLVLMPLCSMHL